jgi:hypothetical protein
MTTKGEIKYKMYSASTDYLLKNANITKDLPEYQASLDALLDTTRRIRLIDGQQKNVRTGIAKGKKEMKAILVAITAENSGKVFAFAKLKNSKELMDEVNFSLSEISRMTDTELSSFSEALYKKAEANVASLDKYGITPETQKKFAEVLSAFNNYSSRPRVSIAERREATKELETLFLQADSIISKIDAIVKIIRFSEVNFYNGYTSVRKLVNAGSGAVDIKAAASDIETRKPLKDAIFTFRTNGTVITKKTATRGNFHIKNIQPGIYEILVKKAGYKDKAVTLNVLEGERKELSVELEKA